MQANFLIKNIKTIRENIFKKSQKLSSERDKTKLWIKTNA